MKDVDTFQCDVVVNQTAVPVVTEPARDSIVGHWKIVVSFNPILAGEYRITISVNGRNVGGEVYRKVYMPGDCTVFIIRQGIDDLYKHSNCRPT